MIGKRIVLWALLTGASSTALAQSYYPIGLLPWSAARAKVAAMATISSGNLFVYSTGGIACRPAVDNPSDRELANTLPSRFIACGCIITDFELRSAQVEYARIFNGLILDHVRTATD